MYHCVSTEDPEEQKCYFYIITSKKYTILKRSSESSGTSRTYTQLNQNTGEDFLEKVFSDLQGLQVFKFDDRLIFYRFEEPTIAALLASNSSNVMVSESKSF